VHLKGEGHVQTALWFHCPNENVFRAVWQVWLSEVQQFFESQGPAAQKALSPKLVCVGLKRSIQVSAECRLLGRALVKLG